MKVEVGKEIICDIQRPYRQLYVISENGTFWGAGR